MRFGSAVDNAETACAVIHGVGESDTCGLKPDDLTLRRPGVDYELAQSQGEPPDST